MLTTEYLESTTGKKTILIQEVSNDDLMRRCCDMTRKPGMVPSKMTREKIYKCEHSPARAIIFWIELLGIPSFVSTHLVRHKIGVEHYVESNRDDRGGAGDDNVTRNTPVNHGLLTNAQALIHMARKRLCYASHVKTVGVFRRLKKEMHEVDPALSEALVPDCVYRNGLCPELRECKPGLERVMKAYNKGVRQ
jgi:hypothetical protein